MASNNDPRMIMEYLNKYREIHGRNELDDEEIHKYVFDHVKAQVVAPPVKQRPMAPAKPKGPKRFSHHQLSDMVNSRFAMKDDLLSKATYSYFHHLTDDKITIFIVYNEQPSILDDDANLFPSDALITKLRLLLG